MFVFFYIYNFIDLTESIFQVDYKLESIDLLIEGDLELGPIIDYSTLNDLTDMVNIIDSEIFFIVFHFFRCKQQYRIIQILLLLYIMLQLIMKIQQ